MANELSEHVTVTITTDNVGLARAGFGVMLILSENATWLERTRTYEDITDVAGDWATSSPEYRAAQAAFSQTPRTQSLKIGRAALKPTQVYVIGVALVQNSTAYTANVVSPYATVSNPLSFTSDATATNDEIVAGVVAMLNGVVGKNYLAAATGAGGSQVCTVTANIAAWAIATIYAVGVLVTNGGNIYQCITGGTSAGAGGPSGTNADITDNTVHWKYIGAGASAGQWFSIEVGNTKLLSISQTHVDPGVATDLDTIVTEDDDWYALHTMYNSKAYVLAAAAWIETQRKIYLVDVNETASLAAIAGATDTLASLFALTYNRTAGAYYPSPASMFSAAWLGRVLPDEPGSETWKFKPLSGQLPVKLTTTQRANLRARKANCYTKISSVNNTWEGTVAGGSFAFIDRVRGRDWIEDDMAKSIYEAISGPEKLGYSNPGIAVVRNAIKASLKRAAGKGIITSTFVIEVPKVSAVPNSDKLIRRLRNAKWSATFEDAIHGVDTTGALSAIDGTVAV